MGPRVICLYRTSKSGDNNKHWEPLDLLVNAYTPLYGKKGITSRVRENLIDKINPIALPRCRTRYSVVWEQLDA